MDKEPDSQCSRREVIATILAVCSTILLGIEKLLHMRTKKNALIILQHEELVRRIRGLTTNTLREIEENPSNDKVVRDVARAVRELDE